MQELTTKEQELLFINTLGYPIYKKLKTDDDIPQNWTEATGQWCFEEYDYKAIYPQPPIGFKFENILHKYEVLDYIDIESIRYIVYKKNSIISITPYYMFFAEHKVNIEDNLSIDTPLKVVYRGTDREVASLLLNPNETSESLEVITEADDYEVFINPTDLASFDKANSSLLAKRVGRGFIDIKALKVGMKQSIYTISLNVQEKVSEYITKLMFEILDNNRLIRKNDRVKYNVITDAFNYKVESLDETKVRVDVNNKELVILNEGFARLKISAKRDGYFEKEIFESIDIYPPKEVDTQATRLMTSVEKLTTLVDSLHYIHIQTNADFSELEVTSENTNIVDVELLDADVTNPIRIKCMFKNNTGTTNIKVVASKAGMLPNEVSIPVICKDATKPAPTLEVTPTDEVEFMEQTSYTYTATGNGEITATSDNKFIQITKQRDNFEVFAKAGSVGKSNIKFTNSSNGSISKIVTINVLENTNKPTPPVLPNGTKYKTSSNGNITIPLSAIQIP